MVAGHIQSLKYTPNKIRLHEPPDELKKVVKKLLDLKKSHKRQITIVNGQKKKFEEQHRNLLTKLAQFDAQAARQGPLLPDCRDDVGRPSLERKIATAVANIAEVAERRAAIDDEADSVFQTVGAIEDFLLKSCEVVIPRRKLIRWAGKHGQVGKRGRQTAFSKRQKVR
jgi:predicted  nucleic acid-binding Zn-ribbon protein